MWLDGIRSRLLWKILVPSLRQSNGSTGYGFRGPGYRRDKVETGEYGEKDTSNGMSS